MLAVVVADAGAGNPDAIFHGVGRVQPVPGGVTTLTSTTPQ